MQLNIMAIISEVPKYESGECADNELLYADIKWCLFSQNTPAQLLDSVTDLAQAQQKNICVPSTTEAVLEILSMQKGHHSSAQQTCDTMHSPLPSQHHTGVLGPFPVHAGPVVSMGGLSRMCPMLSCTALGEQPHCGTVADPEQGRLAASSCPEQG